MAWAGAFVVGLCVGLLGAGGSILTIPILIYVVGEPEKAAIAESLAIVGLVASASALQYARKKLIVWRTAAVFGTPGMAGAYLGAAVAAFVPAALQLILLAVVMILASVSMLRPPRWSQVNRLAYWKVALQGLMVGCLSGLLGVGGGFLIVPTLALLGGLPMRQAVGTSLVIMALSALTGFWKHWHVLAATGVELDTTVIWIFAGVAILGSYAGSTISHALPQPRVRQVFAVVVFLTALYLTSQNLPGLLAD